jgi:hypothetical protein
MPLEFQKPTDASHEIQLDSSLQQGMWVGGRAVIGYPAGLIVRTSFVGEGATIEITAKVEGGRSFGSARGVVRGNVYVGEVAIPDSLEEGDLVYFEINLPQNGVTGESNRIPVILPPIAEEMSWGQEQARRGDRLTLSARIRNIPNRTDVAVRIYEYDRDGVHDLITELETQVRDGRVEVVWEYEYHEDTDELPTDEELQEYGESYNPPEYFFTIFVDGFELGLEQESGLLVFQDYLELEMVDGNGAPLAGRDYTLHLPDGSTRDGTLDDQGRAREEDIPPGRTTVEVPEQEEDDSASGESGAGTEPGGAGTEPGGADPGAGSSRDADSGAQGSADTTATGTGVTED